MSALSPSTAGVTVTTVASELDHVGGLANESATGLPAASSISRVAVTCWMSVRMNMGAGPLVGRGSLRCATGPRFSLSDRTRPTRSSTLASIRSRMPMPDAGMTRPIHGPAARCQRSGAHRRGVTRPPAPRQSVQVVQGAVNRDHRVPLTALDEQIAAPLARMATRAKERHPTSRQLGVRRVLDGAIPVRDAPAVAAGTRCPPELVTEQVARERTLLQRERSSLVMG